MTPAERQQVRELVDAETRNGLHELLRERPDLLELGVDRIAVIFHAGVVAGSNAMRRALT